MTTPPNGHRAVAVGGGALRAVPTPPPAARTARAAGRGRRLQDGMAITADVDARVLGLHLLALHADVVVTPAQIAVAVNTARTDASTDGTVPPRRRAALARLPAGDGLAAATRALESGAGELRRARERMP